MQNGPTTTQGARPNRPAGSYAARSKRWPSNAGRPDQNNSQSAQRSYERYLALARTEVQNGNTIAAENYYQHAEHYFRSMRPEPDGT
jgi:Domain of unknown function (DUF4167)